MSSNANDLNTIWEEILKEAHKFMPTVLFKRVSSSIIPMDIDHNSIHIGVLQSYMKDVIESQPVVSRPLQEAITKTTGSAKSIVVIDLSADKEEQSEPANSTDNMPHQEKLYTPSYNESVFIDRSQIEPHPMVSDLGILGDEPVRIPDEPMVPPVKQTLSTRTNLSPTDMIIDLSASNLNPAFRFDNYITGNANRIPFSAAKYVAEHPGKDYNPLFIYGPSGLGKTHLMHAIGNAISESQPNLKVISITSENFMNIFIESIKKGQGELFRNTFRNIDVLMIDDIQFLDNKQGTKTEFFNTFNELYNKGKQIVLTSDTMPDDMDQFEDRIRSRFQAGFVATMEHPDLETRIAILKALIERENVKGHVLNIDNDAINYTALQFDENIRKLQGAFTRLISTASMERRTAPIDLEYAKTTLSPLITTERVTYVDIETIQNYVSNYFNIKKQDLLGKKRKAEFAFPRQVAMYLCRDIMNESYPEIAKAFSRDHTTILHAYDKITKEIEKNPEVKELIRKIKLELSTSN